MILREPVLKRQMEGIQSEYELKRLDNFWVHIFEQPLKQTYRRNREYYLQDKQSGAKVIERYLKICNWEIVSCLAERKSLCVKKKYEKEIMSDAK